MIKSTAKIHHVMKISIMIVLGLIIVAYNLSAIHIYINNSAFPHFPIDLTWMLIFSGLLLASGILILLHQERLVTAFLFIITALFFLIAAIIGKLIAVFIIWIWVLISTTLFGHWLFKRLGFSNNRPVDEEILLSTGLGFVATAIFVAVIGHLKLLYPFVAWVWLLFISFVGGYTYKRAPFSIKKKLFVPFRNWFRNNLQINSFLLMGLGICLFGSLIWALAPTNNPDALNYHIGVPEIYIREKGINPVPETHNSYITQYSEMLFTFALMLTGQPLPGLIHFTFSLLAAGASFLLARRYGGTRAGLLAAFLFYTAPFVAFQAGIPKNELFLAYYVPFAALTAINWWETKQRHWLLISGLFSGVAIGSKYSALIILFPLIVVILFLLFFQKHSFKQFYLDLLLFSLFTIVPFIPWLIRNYYWTGDPLYPIQTPIQFFKLNSDLEYPYLLSRTAQPFGNPFTLLIRLTGNCGMLCKEMPGSAMGILPLAFLPWFTAWDPMFKPKRRFLLFSSLFMLISVYISFYFLRSARYSIGLYPLLAALSALNFESAYRHIKSSTHRTIFFICAGLLLFSYTLSTRLILTDTLWTNSERYPYHLILGMKSQKAFLSESLPVYEALQFLNRQPESSIKVLSLGSESRAYTRARIFGPIFASESRRILFSANSEKDLARKLKENNYNYILIFPAGQRKDPEFYTSPYLSDYFYKKYTQLVFAANTVRVYRFYPDGSPTLTSTSVNLLLNPGFESLMNGEPTYWTSFGNPIVSIDGHKSRSGNIAILVEGPSVSGLSQDVVVHPSEIYTVGYWARTDDNNQILQVFIEWYAKNRILIRREADWQPVSNTWAFHFLSSTAPQDAYFARIHVSISSKGKVWFDDICFVQGQFCQ